MLAHRLRRWANIEKHNVGLSAAQKCSELILHHRPWPASTCQSLYRVGGDHWGRLGPNASPMLGADEASAWKDAL